MPVVINELEVVPETTPPPEAGTRRGKEADSAKQEDKPDFENVLRHWHERAERVRAH